MINCYVSENGAWVWSLKYLTLEASEDDLGDEREEIAPGLWTISDEREGKNRPTILLMQTDK